MGFGAVREALERSGGSREPACTWGSLVGTESETAGAAKARCSGPDLLNAPVRLTHVKAASSKHSKHGVGACSDGVELAFGACLHVGLRYRFRSELLAVPREARDVGIYHIPL